MTDPTTLVSAAAPGPGSIIIWDWGTLASVSFAFTALGSLATWLWTRGGKAAMLAEQIRVANAAMVTASMRADTIQARYDDLLKSLHEHMIADAGSFARLEAIATEAGRTSVAAEVRLTAALEHLGQRIDSMSERFDTLIARIAPGAQLSGGRIINLTEPA